MSRAPLSISLESARRLAVTKQHLSGRLPPRSTKREILAVVRDLAYVQWDPVAIVAPSHLLSLWSRLGGFRPTDLDALLWKEKKLFEHWTPVASIVLTEDYPLYRSLMRRYPESLSKSWRNHIAPAKRFLAQHVALRRRILAELRKGPLPLGQFRDHLRTKRDDGEWTPASDVAHMLFHLSMSGEVMVVGHEGNQNIWGLSERFLPTWTDRTDLTVAELEHETAQRALRALGTATPAEINYYFIRGRYQDLRGALARLEKEDAIHRVRVEGLNIPEERYIHDRDLPLLKSLDEGAWEPRMALLPPFDNLVCSQPRTQRLFHFDYVREQFLPPAKRKYGTYVLPILWGERLIGRIDPRLDRALETLVVNAVHAEPDAPEEKEVARRVGETIADLAEFVGAREVAYTSRVPAAWKSALS